MTTSPNKMPPEWARLPIHLDRQLPPEARAVIERTRHEWQEHRVQERQRGEGSCAAA